MEQININIEPIENSFLNKCTITKWDDKLVLKITEDDINIKDLIYYYTSFSRRMIFMEVKPYTLKEKLKAVYRVLFE